MVQDLFLPPQGSRGPIHPHAIITIPRSGGTELLLCYDSELVALAGVAVVVTSCPCLQMRECM